MDNEKKRDIPSAEQLLDEMKRLRYKRNFRKTIVGTISSLIVVAAVAVLISMLFLPVLRVTGTSMTPTLYNDELVICSKRSDYDRGDMIAFYYNNKILLKRVIGLPGDKIKLENGRLYINGKIVERKQLEDFVIRDAMGNAERYRQYEETLPNGVKHKIMEVSDKEFCDEYQEVEVPQGMYFMMGDNRDRSDDSRVNVGFVPINNLIGKARFLFFSHNTDEAWYKPWTWPKKIRWSRLFNVIR